MRRYSLIARRLVLALSCSLVASLAVVASAQAVIVTVGGNEAGVSLVPSARQYPSTTADYLNNAGITVDTSTGSCNDPAASTEPDILQNGTWPVSSSPFSPQPLCWHGGPVMHANETFLLEWEGQAPNSYPASTRGTFRTTSRTWPRPVDSSSTPTRTPPSTGTAVPRPRAPRTTRFTAERATTTAPQRASGGA